MRMSQFAKSALSALICCTLVLQPATFAIADEYGQDAQDATQLLEAHEEEGSPQGEELALDEPAAPTQEDLGSSGDELDAPEDELADEQGEQELDPAAGEMELLTAAPAPAPNDEPIDLSLVMAPPSERLMSAGGGATLMLAASPVSSIPDKPIENYVWPLSAQKAIVYLAYDQGTQRRYGVYHLVDVKKYDLETGEVNVIAELPESGSWIVDNGEYYANISVYFANDTLYCAENKYVSGDGRYVSVSAINLVPGSTSQLFTSKVPSNTRNIGVDGNGRIYIDVWDKIYVFDQSGNQLALVEGTPSISSFVGFDVESGNIYYEGDVSYYSWGYDHQMTGLKVANLKGSTLSYDESKAITILYQIGFYAHHGSAELIDGRYLADLTTFAGNRLAILDSHAINYNEVTATRTVINSDGTSRVSNVNLPESTVLLEAQTHDSQFENSEDITSVGTRCAYISSSDLLAVATQTRQVTCYKLSDGSVQGTVDASLDIYKLMAVGDELVAIERTADGSYYVERFSAQAPSSLAISGPSSLQIAESADFVTETSSVVKPQVRFESSDPTILSIDDEGHAATWREGSVTITVTSTGGLTATKKVTVKGGGITKMLPDAVVLGGKNVNNWNANNYRTYGVTVKSYLAQTSSNLMRVQSTGSEVLVEYYNGAGKLTSSKTIKNELPIFGGFFEGADAHYLVFGQKNPDQSDSQTVVRVVKYDTSWKRLGACDIAGVNTTIPFDVGSVRMTESGGKLYVHTSHEMYKTSDGYHHQANMSLAIDEASMNLVDSYSGIMNLSEGYVSHSFNQFVQTDGTNLYRVDQGDYGPRGIALTVTPLDGSLSKPSSFGVMQEYANDYGWGNYTGVALGDFQLSDTNAIVAYSEDATDDSNGARNIVLTSYALKGGSKSVRQQVTTYESSSAVTCYAPHLTKLDGRHFLLSWAEYDKGAGTYGIALAQVDHRGAVIGDIVRKTLAVSDCEPIVLSDGSVAWYVSSGSSTELFTLNPYNLAAVSDEDFEGELLANLDKAVVASIADQQYAGAAVEPDVTVSLDGVTLQEGVDYRVSYKNNTKAGTGSVTVTGMGSYGGSKTVTFTIKPIDIAKVTVGAIADQSYTGDAFKPTPTVKLGSATLANGTDYTLSYANNVNAGTATITVTGKGNYGGTKAVTFKIVAADIAKASVDAITDRNYTGTAIRPLPVVKYGAATLVNGTDYTLSYSNNVNAGTATVLIEGKGNYRSTKSVTFKIGAAGVKNVKVSKVSDRTYTGHDIKPEVTVTYGSQQLKSGVDYSVSYRDNVNVGTAVIAINGKGNLSGSMTTTFGIKPATITSATIESVADQTFTGKAIKPKPMVTIGETTLVYGTDYTLAYENNISVGTGTITITGRENYAGTRSVTFKIVPASLAKAVVSAPSNQSYTGSAITPTPTVRLGTTTLAQGTDYTLSYQDNTNAGVATLTVKGKGNYTGTADASFKITPIAISRTTIDPVADQRYTGNAVKPAIVVRHGSSTLKAGSDYTLSYSDNTKVGTASVTVTGKGNYTGSKTVSFRIVGQDALDIAKATVATIADQTYTGVAIKPAVTVKYGSTTLKSGTDYTVTYANNVEGGTAKVTIAGKGAYMGTKTVSFKIVKPASATDISTASVSTIANQTYTGSAITPAPVVRVGSVTLKNGTDYVLSYKGNVNAGTATIAISGKGDYMGTKNVTFRIVPASIANATIGAIADQTHTGSAITPAPSVKVGSVTLKSGTDYTLGYKNNVNVGTATITVTGKGNYTGSKNVTFKIVSKADPTPTPVVETQKMYRLYNSSSGEHFYTANLSERNALRKIGWKYEGVGWVAPVTSKTPVYRLYNKHSGDHHYTVDAGEKDALAKMGWNYEGIGWYSDDAKGTPLYRQFNPYAVTGSHNYTTDKAENDALVKIGWHAEGIGWYGMKQ